MTVAPPPSGQVPWTAEFALAMVRDMLRIRRMEERAAELYGDLKMDLLAHARRRLGAAVAPKEIAFLASLPRTRSGKIMRRLLKARELGLPEGDTSTLESA